MAEDLLNELAQKIAEDAKTGVQSTSVDGTSVTRMPVSDQIAAAEFLKKEQITNVYKALGIFRVSLR